MKKLFYLVTLFFWGCIGTDVIDDPIVAETLTIDQDIVILLVGQKETLSVSYTNQYGISENIEPSWVISNTQIASVNNLGEITALSSGQTGVRAILGEVISNEVLVNIALNETEVIKVIIENPTKSQIDIGETLQLNASAWNINDIKIDGLIASWSVNDEAIASISQTGLLEGKTEGVIEVTASIGGLESIPITIDIGSQTRTGTFDGRNGYIAIGTAVLSKNNTGEIILTFSDDFQTSFALGTYIYLSNSTSASDTNASGLDLGQISTNGAKVFNVTTFKTDVTLGTYRYVIVLCKPASITFGVADFN
jgi:hypothetical protein